MNKTTIRQHSRWVGLAMLSLGVVLFTYSLPRFSKEEWHRLMFIKHLHERGEV